MSSAPGLERILDRFRRFSETLDDQSLYGSLTRSIADDPEVAGLLSSAGPGQERPVLLLAAVQDLLLAHPDLAAARWYRSITAEDELATGDPYPAFRKVCLDHAAELRQVIATRATQTNEVNRVALLVPLIARACADIPSQPVAVVELGCSSGLLLGLERYRIEIGGKVAGDLASSVRLSAEVVGSIDPPMEPFPPMLTLVDRVGIDLAPVSLDDEGGLRWLQACLWPDQRARFERFRAAVDRQRQDPPRLVAGDLIERLPEVVATLPPDAHLVVFHCWALTYVSSDRRPALAATLSELAAGGRPVSWLSAEPPGCVPGIDAPPLSSDPEATTPDTVLGMRRWRTGTEQEALTCGWAHPHGNWLDWSDRPPS